jgi:enediyne biosynthesis protein E3
MSDNDTVLVMTRSSSIGGMLQLPVTMADFGKRGFRTESEFARSQLERHARSFLTGFNIAAAHWRADVHAVLGDVAEVERGFAYEGAGMYCAARDLMLVHKGRSLRWLLSGPGERYTHLVHTGAGWLWSPMRLPLPVPLPATPLLRWLALDGAGFGEVYFGGLRILRKRVRPDGGPTWQVRIAGCGRAMWFVLCADPASIAAEIASAPAAAQPWLWSGVGLAAGYAGAIEPSGLDLLVESAGRYRSHLAQGVVFAVAARARAGAPPEHSNLACARVLSAPVEQAVRWADAAAVGLTERTDVAAYLTWKQNIRESVAQR